MYFTLLRSQCNFAYISNIIIVSSLFKKGRENQFSILKNQGGIVKTEILKGKKGNLNIQQI